MCACVCWGGGGEGGGGCRCEWGVGRNLSRGVVLNVFFLKVLNALISSLTTLYGKCITFAPPPLKKGWCMYICLYHEGFRGCQVE